MDAIFAMYGARVAKLGRIAYGLTNGDHGGVQYTESGTRYLRGQSVTELGLDLEKDTKFIADSEHKRMIRAEVVNGDVLYTIAGSIGNACLVSGLERANINQAIVRIKPGPAVIGQYLCDFLNSDIGKLQSRRIANGGVQLNINFSEVKALKVLLPEPDVQERFVKQLADARHSYKAALNKADELLASIDEYLLSELDVTLPPEPENTIANRIFTAQRKELTGWRFDARVHQYNFNLHSARHPNLPLKQLAHINPRTVFSGVKDETPLTFVPMESISDEDGSIAAPQRRNYSENIGYTSFQEGDLLWAKITPCMENGKSAVAQNLLNGFGFGSTEYHVFRPKSGDLSVHYLHAILRMKLLRKAAKSYFGGSSGHQRVDEAFFYRLTVPVPPHEVQGQLAKRIESIRQEAQRLRSNALAELNAAKRRIEAMLLGEENA